FQAEDGIRDVAVTGVQTCALPISTTVRVLGGADQAADFALSEGWVQGHVVAQIGLQPVAGASLTLRTEPEGDVAATATSGADGSFTLARVAPGSYVITATREGYGRWTS